MLSTSSALTLHVLCVYTVRMSYSTIARRATELRRALERENLDPLTVRTLDASGAPGDAVRALVNLSRTLHRFARDSRVAADEWWPPHDRV